jgi:nucleotide-binding universal stress UspA family protein
VDEIVVGYDGSDEAKDALALGLLLARTTGARLLAAYVYLPVMAIDHSDLAAEMRSDAEQLLEDLPPEVDTRIVESSSAARGLHDLAEAEGADLVVLGPSHRTPAGRLVVGSVGERLLHGSPCALAVAPHGFAAGERRLEAIAVGYDGGSDAELALADAVELARAARGTLLIVAIVQPAESALEGGYDTLPTVVRAREQEMERTVQAALDSLPAEIDATGEVIAGGRDELAAHRGVDLLVVGSRGYGPVKRVLLGSTAAALIHNAQYPVIVHPRGAGDVGAGTDVQSSYASS